MESYIQISKINDFLYSPKSLYLHGVYESFNQNTYHETPQKEGKLNHQNIEDGKYSTSKHCLQGLSVYSSQYNIGGKIDIYDTKTKSLIERKTKIKNIYLGHKFQLYAQMFSMREAGYEINNLYIHSLSDNKRYSIPLPDIQDIKLFELTLNKIRNYNLEKLNQEEINCDLSIYRHLSY